MLSALVVTTSPGHSSKFSVTTAKSLNHQGGSTQKLTNTPTEDSQIFLEAKHPEQQVQHLSIISVHLPKLTSAHNDKEQLCKHVGKVKTPHSHEFFMPRHSNAEVGRDNSSSEAVVGKYRTGKGNHSGLLLQMQVMRTLYSAHLLCRIQYMHHLHFIQKSDMCKTTLMQKSLEHWHTID